MIAPRFSASFFKAAAFLLALQMIAALDARAQSVGLGSADGPLEITADNGIEWRRDERIYIARGNARAARGEVTVLADELQALYREGDNSDIYQVMAIGNVRIFTPRERVSGDRAVYNLDQAKIVITGNDLKLETQTDTITAEESLEYYEREQRAVARGDAVVVREDQRLAADFMEAFFTEGPEGGNDLVLERVDAIGDVRISTPKDFARGDTGVYYADREVATLEGDVRITSGENQLNGGYAEVNLKTGVSRMMGAPGGGGTRVRGLLLPQEKPDQPDGQTNGQTNGETSGSN